VSRDREQRHGQAPADLRTRLDKYFRRPALPVQLRSVTGADGRQRAWNRRSGAWPFAWTVFLEALRVG